MSRAYVRDDGVSSIGPVERRKAWSRALIERATGAPAYGSPEWLALPDGPEKVAACVRAAECWATEGDEVFERLAREVEVTPIWSLAHKQAEDAAFVERGRRHAEQWKGGLPRPDQAEAVEIEREWQEWVSAGD